MKPFGDRTAWFVTGSQGLYGDDVLAQVADDARLIADGLDGAPAVPVRVVAEAGGHVTRRHRPAPRRGRRRPGLPGRRRLDAHLLARQDVDRGAARAAQAARPPAHPGEPRPALGDHRHGLHEPEPVGARRPGVRVHAHAAAGAADDGRRPLAGPRGHGAPRVLGTGRRRGGRGAPPPGVPLRRQHAPGRGHRGRQDRGPGPPRRLGRRIRRQRPGGGGPGRLGRRGRRRRRGLPGAV